MKMKIIIQARTGSTRLPRKMVMPFYKGKSLLAIVIERLLSNFSSADILVATTRLESDTELEKIAIDYGVNCYRGSSEDVLSRFVEAGRISGSDVIVRVCADNPFLMPTYIQPLIDELITNQSDYVSYGLPNGLPSIKSHFGLFAEAVSLSALEEIWTKNVNAHFKEHVTNFLYSNTDQYDIKLLPLPRIINYRSDLRFTVDNQYDFDLMKELYFKLSGTLDLVELINAVDLNPSYLESMERQINVNLK